MNRSYVLPVFLMVVALILFEVRLGTSWANDLEDGISKPTDDSVSEADNIGQPDKNIKYLIVKAKSKAGDTTQQGADGSGNMNSVVVGPGSNIKGDVIIIDQSRGSKTQVVE